MAERTANLYNQPSEGLAYEWYGRNQTSEANLRILDMAVVLSSPYEKWDGRENTPYTLLQTIVRNSGVDIFPKSGPIYQIWQDNKKGLEERGERIDPKAHLDGFSEGADDRLNITLARSDWSLMSLGPMLRDRRLPEDLRDQILPINSSPLPNHLVLHLALLTADHHLIMTVRSRNVAFEQGTISASVEQHINPDSEKPLDDTIDATVSKLKKEAELKVTLKPATLRVGAIIIEPNVNNTGIVVVGQCQEHFSEIGEELIGSSRRSEFAADRPVRTLAMDKPERWVTYFHNPEHALHGTTRLRMLIAASYIYGYQEVLRLLSQS